MVDVIAVLTDSPNPQVYWRVLKKRLKDEGNESVTNCNALKMEARTGKKVVTPLNAKSVLQFTLSRQVFQTCVFPSIKLR